MSTTNNEQTFNFTAAFQKSRQRTDPHLAEQKKKQLPIKSSFEFGQKRLYV